MTNQWEHSSPTDENFDETLLLEAFDEGMSDGSFSQSALVIRNERIVHEEYRGITEQEKQTLIDNNVPEQLYTNFDFRDRFSLASSWSVAKSFVSILPVSGPRILAAHVTCAPILKVFMMHLSSLKNAAVASVKKKRSL